MNFDIDLNADLVRCPRVSFYPKDDEVVMQYEKNREILQENTNGPIIPLGSYYGASGIP